MSNKELSAADKYRQERKQRLAKAAKKNARKSHKLNLSEKAKTAIAVIVVIAIFIGIGIPLGINGYKNSASREQKIMALQYKDMQISKPVYAYFATRMFNNIYQTASQYSQYGIDMGYDVTKSPADQAYVDTIEGYENPTWMDYIDYSAKETIKQIEIFCEKAAELGLTLDDEHKAELEKNMASVDEQAAQYNVSAKVFLESSYGKGVTKAVLRELIEKQLIAEMYSEHMQEEYKNGYTDKQLDKYYKDNKDNYEVVSLRYYAINADKEDVKSTDEEGNETTNQKVTDATMAKAEEKAKAFAAECTSEDAFKALAAKDYKSIDKDAAKAYETTDSKTLYANQTRSDLSSLSEDALKWAFSADKGATYVDKNEGSGYTVYMVSVPAGKNLTEDMTYDVRHILVKFPEAAEDAAEETADTAETTEETAEPTEAAEETTEAAEEKTAVEIKALDVNAYGDTVIDLDVDGETAINKEGYKKAQDILEEYLNGNKTEDSFAALAEKYSEDVDSEGKPNNDGIYTDVPLGQMVPEFEAWAIKDGRKAGDVGIVEHDGGESGYSGYHIMYSVGLTKNGPSWEKSVKNDKAAEDFTEHTEKLLKEDEFQLTVLDEEAIKGALDFISQLAASIASQNAQ